MSSQAKPTDNKGDKFADAVKAVISGAATRATTDCVQITKHPKGLMIIFTPKVPEGAQPR